MNEETKRALLISNSTLYGSGYLDHAESEIRDFLGDAKKALFVPSLSRSRSELDAYGRNSGRTDSSISRGERHARGRPALRRPWQRSIWRGLNDARLLLSRRLSMRKRLTRMWDGN